MHVLQSLFMPPTGMPAALYLRMVTSRTQGVPVAVPKSDGGPVRIVLDTGHVLSTDTFLNGFFSAYWFAYTTVRELAVAVHFRGRGKVRVMEDTGQGVRLLTEVTLDAPARQGFLVELPQLEEDNPFGLSRPSRLFVEVEAERPSQLFGLDYVTEQPPLRSSTLSVGLCTFNQEERFARTLAAVADIAESSDRIEAIHVVNQGDEFASSRIRALLAHPRMRAVRQRNLGGCGGFTRSLADALRADKPASHHLMMDDDIVLDARMILRALRFLDYADKDIVLGAGMLDSMQPTVMYEAGAFLRAHNIIEPYCHNVDLADHRQQWRFNSPVKTDYNAWWFCILPLDRCRQVGLPAPVFIRGDDFEYGQRLARAGVPTVTLPGIAVWHEPFYAKPPGWQSYYDLRNRLIFAATYPERVRQLSLAHVAGLITNAILTHSYAIAALRMRAVADFLKGPDALFAQDAAALHGEIMELNRTATPEKLDDRDWKQHPTTPGKPRSERIRGLAWQYLLALLRTGAGPLLRRGEAVLMDLDAHPRNTAGRAYVLTNGQRSFHLRFRPRTGLMWRQIGQAVAIIWRYRRQRGAMNRAWLETIDRYRSSDWWQSVFARPAPDADKGKPHGKPETGPGDEMAVAQVRS